MNNDKGADAAHAHLKTKRRKKGKEKQILPVADAVTMEVGSVGEEDLVAGSVSIGKVKKGKVIDDTWDWATLASSSSSSQPCLFTKDGSYFFSILGSCVKIYSVASGKVVSTLSPSSTGSSTAHSSDGEGHKDVITAAILHPQNPYQLLTASLDGFIKVWDYLEAVLLQNVDTGMPVTHMCAHEKLKGYVFVATPTSRKKLTGNSSILRVSLKATDETISSRVHTSSNITFIGRSKCAKGLAISPDGSWIVAIAGCKAYVASTSSLETGFTKFVSPETLCYLAFHPTEQYFVTGDDQGQIRLWYCLNNPALLGNTESDKKAPTTTLHWHAHAVNCINFTPNGAYMLSGGEEGVLVIWQLQSGRKEFVPRVGAPITSIAVHSTDEGEEYVLGLSDGNIVFVNANQMSITRTITRIKIDPVTYYGQLPLSASVPIAAHPLSRTLILPSSHPSSLQMYVPSTHTLHSELEVSPSNRVSRRDEKAIQFSRVEKVSVCSTGDWMATLDCRLGDEDFQNEIYLKIWHWEDSAWVLTTRIDRPHRRNLVVSMAFSPQPISDGSHMLMTAGQDGSVKVWTLRTLKGQNGKTEDLWACRSTFHFRSEIPQNVAWSHDSSLLAVVYEPYVLLVEPQTNAIVDALVSMELKDPDSCQFVGQGSRYLLLSNQKDAIIWDLITRTVLWHRRSPGTTSHVVAHPREDVFALLEQENRQDHSTKVLVFDAASPTPIETKTVPFLLRSIAWYPSAGKRFSLVGITKSWDVVLLGDGVEVPKEEGTSARAIDAAAQVSRTSLFQDIFGSSAFFDTSAEKHAAPVSVTHDIGQSIQSVLSDAPAYLAPPVESLYSDLMSALLTKRTKEEPPAREADDAADQDMVDMEPQEEPVSQSLRTIGEEEFEEFVEFFRDQTLSVKSVETQINTSMKTSKLPPKATPNGKLVNGAEMTSKPHINGVSPAAKTSPSKKVDSPTVKVGQKRKKSLA